MPCDRIPKPRRPRRPHAVEHIRAERHTDHQVLRVPNAHHIAWLLLWKQRSARVDDLAKLLLRFAAAQPADRNARRVARDHRFAALAAQVEVEPALDDAEEVLGRGVGVAGDAAVEPADGAVHGFGHAREVGGGGLNYVVELHDDVAADAILEGH